MKHPTFPTQAETIEGDEDPFGPYEFVEIGDRCLGAEGDCDWHRCTQRRSTCRCMCPHCCGDTPDVWGAPVY